MTAPMISTNRKDSVESIRTFSPSKSTKSFVQNELPLHIVDVSFDPTCPNDK